MWNQWLREALAIIRQTNPKRTVIIGPASWYSINLLEKLELPEDDRQIIASVHYYNPFAFTHQGAPWTGNKDKVGIPWNGTQPEQQAILRDFDKAQTWARGHSRPLYLGEFGAYDKGDMASRVRWTSFVARSAEKLGWSWGYWQFDGATEVPSPVQLTLQYGAIGQQRKIFKGDQRHPPLRYEDVFAFLPFQVSSRKLVIAVYVMTYDITKPMQEQQYRLAIQGLPAETTPLTLYDPITGTSSALQVTREEDAVEVTVPVVDYPRMMVVESF